MVQLFRVVSASAIPAIPLPDQQQQSVVRVLLSCLLDAYGSPTSHQDPTYSGLTINLMARDDDRGNGALPVDAMTASWASA